jgi:hypothetical protein
MRLTADAAFRYASSKVGDSDCTSAMLSKFALFVSSGRKSPALTSMPRQVANDALVFRAIQPLKGSCARIGARSPVDHLFHRLDERLERVARRTRRTRERHHFGAQLPDHLLGDHEILVRRRDIELLERQIAGHQIFVMTILAIRLDHGIERGGRDAARSGRAIRRMFGCRETRLGAR